MSFFIFFLTLTMIFLCKGSDRLTILCWSATVFVFNPAGVAGRGKESSYSFVAEWLNLPAKF